MIKAVIFDFDGTLLDSDKMIVATFEELYKIYKPTLKPEYDHLLTFSGPPIKESLLKEFPNANQEEAFDNFQKISKINYVKYVKPFPYVIEMLQFLRQSNIKIALVTSKGREATNFALELTKLDGLFDFVICADEVKHVKPDPEGVLLALKHLDIKNKGDVIYIGDSIYDYLTAKKAGIKFGYVKFSPRKLPNECVPDFEITSFKGYLKDILHL